MNKSYFLFCSTNTSIQSINVPQKDQTNCSHNDYGPTNTKPLSGGQTLERQQCFGIPFLRFLDIVVNVILFGLCCVFIVKSSASYWMSGVDFGESVESSFCVRNQVLLLGAHGEQRLRKQVRT